MSLSTTLSMPLGKKPFKKACAVTAPSDFLSLSALSRNKECIMSYFQGTGGHDSQHCLLGRNHFSTFIIVGKLCLQSYCWQDLVYTSIVIFGWCTGPIVVKFYFKMLCTIHNFVYYRLLPLIQRHCIFPILILRFCCLCLLQNPGTFYFSVRPCGRLSSKSAKLAAK